MTDRNKHFLISKALDIDHAGHSANFNVALFSQSCFHDDWLHFLDNNEVTLIFVNINNIQVYDFIGIRFFTNLHSEIINGLQYRKYFESLESIKSITLESLYLM